MKRVFTLLLTLLLVFALTACTSDTKPVESGNENVGETSGETSGETLNLRVANVTQVDHPMNKSTEFFAKKIEEKSNGRIKISVFPARQLGDDRELFEQVQQGALDMALVSVGPIGSTTPLAAALQLPFMFDNWDQWLDVMNSEAADELFAGFEDFGVKALAAYDSGFRHTLTIDKQINSPADYAGLKFRVAETPLHVDIFTALGASPTPLPYGEIYTSLQNKVIDGLEMDYAAMKMEKHYEVAKYVTETGHFTWPGVFMVNLDLWNSLSAEDQAMFIEASKEVYEENVEYIKNKEAEAIKELEAGGVTIVKLTDEEKQVFIDKTASVVEKYTSQDPRIKAFYDYAMSLR